MLVTRASISDPHPWKIASPMWSHPSVQAFRNQHTWYRRTLCTPISLQNTLSPLWLKGPQQTPSSGTTKRPITRNQRFNHWSFAPCIIQPVKRKLLVHDTKILWIVPAGFLWWYIPKFWIVPAAQLNPVAYSWDLLPLFSEECRSRIRWRVGEVLMESHEFITQCLHLYSDQLCAQNRWGQRSLVRVRPKLLCKLNAYCCLLTATPHSLLSPLRLLAHCYSLVTALLPTR